MPRAAFDPEEHGFAFANSWEFNREERQQLRETFAHYLTWGGILGAVAFGLLGAILSPLGVLGAATFGLPGAFLIPLGILALRKALEGHLAPGYGLCGGMCFAALDFYHKADLSIPRGQHSGDRPLPRTGLRSYIWKRQMDSIVSDGVRFMAWLIFLNHVPSVWPFRGGTAWLLARSKKEWKKLRASVDGDDPVPIGLVRGTRRVYDNHQVLAIGYDETGEAGGTIYLYEPNCPNRESTICFEFGEQLLDGQESCGAGAPLRGFFCEAYTPCDPTKAVE